MSQTGPSGSGYYDFDASGNTVGITGASGSYVNQYSYLPFGETTTVSATLPNPFTFAGQVGVMQIASDLFYMRTRNYTPATGQFLSNDPLGLAGQDTNLRRYVDNSPVTYVDPYGTDGFISVPAGATGVVTSNGVQYVYQDGQLVQTMVNALLRPIHIINHPPANADADALAQPFRQPARSITITAITPPPSTFP